MNITAGLDVTVPPVHSDLTAIYSEWMGDFGQLKEYMNRMNNYRIEKLFHCTYGCVSVFPVRLWRVDFSFALFCFLWLFFIMVDGGEG